MQMSNERKYRPTLLEKDEAESLYLDSEKLNIKSQQVLKTLIKERCEEYKIDAEDMAETYSRYMSAKLLIFDSIKSIIEHYPNTERKIFSSKNPLRQFAESFFTHGLTVTAIEDRDGNKTSRFCVYVSHEQNQSERVRTLLHELTHVADRAAVDILGMLVFSTSDPVKREKLQKQHDDLYKKNLTSNKMNTLVIP